MKTYWFYLESFTFIFSQLEETLVYNALSNDAKVFKNNNILKKIITQLHDMNNMYCIELTEKEFEDDNIKEMVNFIISSFSGDLIDSDNFNRPIVFPPFLKIQNNITKLTSSEYKGVGEEMISFLKEISIYIGGTNPVSSLDGFDVYKQFDYCKKTEGNYLPFEKIRNFIESLSNNSIEKINFVGGNVFKHPDFNLLINELCKHPSSKYIYTSYRDLPNDLEMYLFLKSTDFSLKVLIDFPIITITLDEIINILNRCVINFDCLFAVTSENEFEEAEALIKKYKLEKVEIKPVFTGLNIDFFKNYIFLTEEDIILTKMNRQEIFINQSLNIFTFGRIKIMTDGKIYTDINEPSIGKIDTPLINLLDSGICESKSWFKIRNQKPCDKCIYQWLCPPLSGYESVIGKPNLCKVKE